jgi:hypothetical protein
MEKYSWQGADGSRQKLEVRDQTSEVRRRRTEGRRQKTEEERNFHVGAAFSRDWNDFNGF